MDDDDKYLKELFPHLPGSVIIGFTVMVICVIGILIWSESDVRARADSPVVDRSNSDCAGVGVQESAQ